MKKAILLITALALLAGCKVSPPQPAPAPQSAKVVEPPVQAGEGNLPSLPERAIQQSQITLPGSKPFHLVAKTFESTDRDNDSHDATIEEYWVAPDKWRRIVKTADFSEVLIVNDDKTSETLMGDYYPNWLRQFVNGIVDPGAPLQGVDISKSTDIPTGYFTRDGNLHIADIGSEVCRRFASLASNPPVTNRVFSTYCFNGGLLESVGKPGYNISYKDYKKFGDKKVARKLDEYIEPGTELEADITELRELPMPADESLFAIDHVSRPLRTVVVSEATVRSLMVSAPDIKWPTITNGRASGTLSIYVALDRQGHVRETLGLNSDNPFMTDAARQQVMKWQFKPASNDSEPVQVESILTFGYDTKIVPSP
ncbi:MAG: energy transducer TonB [Candidatus Acidiferrales bacterium]